MKWDSHIKQICQKTNWLLGFLSRNRKSCPTHLKETAYKLFLRSNLEYCSTIWDPHYVKDIKQLEQVQRRGARVVHRDYSHESCVTDMISDLGWESWQSRHKNARLTLFHKLVHRAVRLNADDYLTKGYSRTWSSNSSKFWQIQITTPAYSNSFFIRTIPEWNRLPETVTMQCRDYGSIQWLFTQPQPWLSLHRCTPHPLQGVLGCIY